MVASARRNALARRQRVLLVTGVLVLVAYYAMCLVPQSLSSGVALVATLFVAVVGAGLALLACVTSQQRKLGYFLVVTVLAVPLALASLPRIRHALLETRLRSLGANVVTSADTGDGVWFRFHGLFLPCWFKKPLGDAFFGDIKEVDFSGVPVPVDELVALTFPKPVETLNLSSTGLSNSEIDRLAESIEAKQVLVNSLSVDGTALESLAKMKSLSRIAAVNTSISKQEAVDFVVRHPSIGLVHGDSETGYGFVFPRLPSLPAAGTSTNE